MTAIEPPGFSRDGLYWDGVQHRGSRHQTGYGRMQIVANGSAAMAEAPVSRGRVGDRRLHLSGRGRSDDGKS